MKNKETLEVIDARRRLLLNNLTGDTSTDSNVKGLLDTLNNCRREINNEVDSLEAKLNTTSASSERNDSMTRDNVIIMKAISSILNSHVSESKDMKIDDNRFLFFDLQNVIDHMGNHLTKIMIRQSYIEIYEYIQELFSMKDQYMGNLPKYRGIAVTGTSGIGKSIFAYFLICMLLRVHKVANKLIYR